MINKNSKIFIAGHNGMVGSAILRKLKNLNYKNIYFRSKTQLNLIDQKKVFNYLSKIKPDAVILAAAKVGGIKANNEKRAEFIFENLSIQNNVINASYENGVKDLIFFRIKLCLP
jgi:GDP-L-fucose synthase